MLLIDETKGYLIGSKATTKGVPFEMDTNAARRLLKAQPTLAEFKEEPEPTTADEFNECEAAEESGPAEDSEPSVSEFAEGAEARYKSGGWYDLDGQSVRLKDIPSGVKIVRR